MGHEREGEDRRREKKANIIIISYLVAGVG